MDNHPLPPHQDVQTGPTGAPPLPRPGRHFTDEQIFAVLRAGEGDDVSATDLCAAHGITLPLYCVWKRKYGALTLDELRGVRRKESKRSRTVGALVAAAAVAGTVAAGLLVLPGGSAVPSAAADEARVRRPAAPVRPSSSPSASTAAAEAAAAAVGGAYDLPSDDDGFVVQIAAMPDLDEARTVVDQLAAAGYPAYLLSTAVENLELFRVRVGPFPTRQQAAATVRELAREGYEGAWLVR